LRPGYRDKDTTEEGQRSAADGQDVPVIHKCLQKKQIVSDINMLLQRAHLFALDQPSRGLSIGPPADIDDALRLAKAVQYRTLDRNYWQ
jgi:hypothetical protein